MQCSKKLLQKLFTIYDVNYEKQVPKRFFPISPTHKINEKMQ